MWAYLSWCCHGFRASYWPFSGRRFNPRLFPSFILYFLFVFSRPRSIGWKRQTQCGAANDYSNKWCHFRRWGPSISTVVCIGLMEMRFCKSPDTKASLAARCNSCFYWGRQHWLPWTWRPQIFVLLHHPEFFACLVSSVQGVWALTCYQAVTRNVGSWLKEDIWHSVLKPETIQLG